MLAWTLACSGTIECEASSSDQFSISRMPRIDLDKLLACMEDRAGLGYFSGIRRNFYRVGPFNDYWEQYP